MYRYPVVERRYIDSGTGYVDMQEVRTGVSQCGLRNRDTGIVSNKRTNATPLLQYASNKDEKPRQWFPVLWP